MNSRNDSADEDWDYSDEEDSDGGGSYDEDYVGEDSLDLVMKNHDGNEGGNGNGPPGADQDKGDDDGQALGASHKEGRHRKHHDAHQQHHGDYFSSRKTHFHNDEVDDFFSDGAYPDDFRFLEEWANEAKRQGPIRW